MRTSLLVSLLALAVLGVALSGCNTIIGMGTDLQVTGHAVQNWMHSSQQNPNQVGQTNSSSGATLAQR